MNGVTGTCKEAFDKMERKNQPELGLSFTESLQNGLSTDETTTHHQHPTSEIVTNTTSPHNGICDKVIPNESPNQQSPDETNHDQNTHLNPTTGKRVRFSICEYITETLVLENGVDGSHANAAFENGEGKGKAMDSGGSKIRYIGGKLRRDSVHPLVPFHTQLKDNWDVGLPSDIDEDEKGTNTPWSDLSTKGKLLRVGIAIGKGIALLVLLYFFICSLDLLSLAFRLVGGRTAGEVFQNSSILQNPVVGLMLGILTTVLVQSSSTSTSILVGMVAAGFMDVKQAIPPIMGANIGTSITNTIVSFTQAGDRDQFRRAFAGATILDMFNWITVIVLLPVEIVFGYLNHVSKATVDLLIPDSQSGGEIQLLSVITNPFVDLIVQLNGTVLECWAIVNCTDADDASLIREYCRTSKTEIEVVETVVDLNGKEVLNIRDVTRQADLHKCDFLFAGTSLSDAAVGAIVLISSLLVLCLCLVMIVKLLNSVLKGHVANIIQHTLNADIPYVPWLTGYIAIFVGALMTFLVQSSSVFTSALTPLVGLGVISLNRVYPLTLGANIGTTTTAILASMAAEGKHLQPSIQIALCHFFFNITGVLLFYPLPFLRFPIGMAKALGNTTAKYRWFAIFYIVLMFAVLPVVFILASLAGSIYVIILVSLIGGVIAVVMLITILQRKVPQILPEWLRDWKWMPLPLRSLKPYDRLLSRISCCGTSPNDVDDDSDGEDVFISNGKTKSRLDGDFVFLTGKIPPPFGFGDEKSPHAKIITKIVPTRVIRNISNGDSFHRNDRACNESSIKPPTIEENESHASGNTVPVPSSIDESHLKLNPTSISQDENLEDVNNPTNIRDSSYINPEESFLV